MIHKWVKVLWTSFLGGALFMLPIVIITVLGQKLLKSLRKISHPLLRFFPEIPIPGIALATVVEIGLFAVLCVLAGWISTTDKGGRFYRWLERYLLDFIPGYTLMRSTLYDIAGQEKEVNTQVVLARIEDAWQIAFLFETLESGVSAVYVRVPSLRSGSLYYLTEDRIKRTRIPFWKARGILRRFGAGSAALLKDII